MPYTAVPQNLRDFLHNLMFTSFLNVLRMSSLQCLIFSCHVEKLKLSAQAYADREKNPKKFMGLTQTSP